MRRPINSVFFALPMIPAFFIIAGCGGRITYPSVPIDELLNAPD